eukprot:m51a1_g10574 putative tkl protein kinase (674) ;mRNA; r:55931-59252
MSAPGTPSSAAVVLHSRFVVSQQDVRKRAEVTRKLEEIARLFVTLSSDAAEVILAPHTLVRDGWLTKVCRKSNKRRRVWLFSDAVMVYGTPAPGGIKYIWHSAILLRRVVLLQDTRGTPTTHACHAMQVISKQKSFTVLAESLDEQHAWCSAFALATGETPVSLAMYRAPPGRSSEAPVWIPDKCSKVCMKCGDPFTLVRRRHHCRNCGKVLCAGCSAWRAVLEHIDPHARQRVCQLCYCSLAVPAEAVAPPMPAVVAPVPAEPPVFPAPAFERLEYVQTPSPVLQSPPLGNAPDPLVLGARQQQQQERPAAIVVSSEAPELRAATVWSPAEPRRNAGHLRDQISFGKVKAIQDIRDKRDHFMCAREMVSASMPSFCPVEGQQEMINTAALGKVIQEATDGLIVVHNELDQRDIELGPLIANGATCHVYKGKLRGLTVAVKEYCDETCMSFDTHECRKEIALLSVLRHPRLAGCIGALTKDPHKLLVVMPYFERNLRSFVKGRDVPAMEVAALALDICQGMSFLHSLEILHRDLKSQNVLISAVGSALITDFGSARFTAGTLSDRVGTVQYTAPEVLRGAKYDERADVFSFGIVLWEIMSRGAIPYGDMDTAQVPAAIMRGERPVMPHSANKVLAKAARKCTKEVPAKRPSFDMLALIFDQFIHESSCQNPDG